MSAGTPLASPRRRACLDARRHRSPCADDNAGDTLDFLAREDLIYTCVDEPQGLVSSIPPIAAATSDLAIVRMHGRVPKRLPYRYSRAELAESVPKIRALAEQTREVHVLMSNAYLDNAIHNARDMMELLDAPRSGDRLAA